MNYNFCRIHKSLRVSPAMAAGLTDELLSMEDIVRLTDAYEIKIAERVKRVLGKIID